MILRAALTALVLLIFIAPLGCKTPLAAANEKYGLENPTLGKNLRSPKERAGFASGLDERTREIEANLGYR